MLTVKKITVVVLILLSLAFATACAPVATPGPGAGGESTPELPAGLPPEVILAAQQWLSDQLGVEIEQVAIVTVEQAEWSDSCLGLGGPAESCAAVITPGWLAVFELNGQQYEVRTNDTGSEIRLATP
jgi:hypothetical protein